MTRTGTDLEDRVRATLDGLAAADPAAGLQVAAYLHGRPVLDVCAGVADPATGRPVTAGTPIFSFSLGKGLASTVVHVLAERGVLDYDLRLARVWPEFGRNGKRDITLAHVLTHTAGLPELPAGCTVGDLTDWDRMCAVLAAATPVWAPGSRHGYHVWTYGWLVGEVVRRVTGRTISAVLAEEVAAPLGVPGELLFGVPEGDLDRLARLTDRGWSAALDALAGALPNLARAVPPGVRPDAALGNRRDVLRADIPAIGTVTARAAARMYAALLGEVDGVRLISADRLRRVSAPAVSGPDWTLGGELTGALGYGIEGPMFGCDGLGGSIAGAAPGLGLAFAATRTIVAVGDGDPLERLRTLVLDAVRADG
ncbi:serine hydrolase domain-containing protein [Plantactinospora siamensis]|uniref:Serine hydrolase domain-containing protein n=1 Tax=Plantactinospora siamensis TaxID=555372 RepID=A0ABV6P674_9ACTN